MASYDDTATVSGSVVSFSDGADEVGLKSCVVSLPASLTGYTESSVYKTGKNLFDGFTKGYGLNSNTGKIVETPSGAISGYIPVKEGVDYYLSGLTDTLRSFVAYYKADKTYISRTGGTKKLYVALTTPSECAYAIVYQYVESGSSASIDDVDNLQTQLEVGSSASSFEPYTEPTSYTENLGQTVYGADADLVSGEGTEDYSVPFTFDGSLDEDWKKHGSLASWFYIDLPFTNAYANNAETGFITSSWGNQKAYANVSSLANGEYAYGAIERFVIKNTDYIEVTDFKQWLSQNPITLVYKLATATDFTFNPVTIETSKGSNTLWSDQGNVEVTYYKDGYGFTSVTVHKETPDGEPVEQTAKLHKIVYGGLVDVVKGKAEPKNLLELYLARTTHLGVNFSLTDKGLLHMEGTNTSSTSFAFSGGNYNDYESCPWKFPAGTYTASSLITADTSKVGSVNFLIRTKTDNVKYSYALKDAPKTFTINDDFGAWFWASVLKTETVNCDVGVQLEKGSSASEYVPHFDPFAFPPISMETDEGENTLFSNEGDSAIVYRKAVE